MKIPIKATKEENKEFEDKFNKGCGNKFRYDGVGIIITCGEKGKLCPSCSPKKYPNPYSFKDSNNSPISYSDKDPETLRYTNQSGSDIPLSDKQEDLFNQVVDKHPDWNYGSFRLFFCMMQDLDAEAVRKLKEDFEQDKKQIEQGAIVVYDSKKGKYGEKKGKMVDIKNVELGIIAGYINNKLEKIDKIFGDFK